MVGLLLMMLISIAASETGEGYHANIGIPLAAKIKALEEEYLKDPVGLSPRFGGRYAIDGDFPFVVGIDIKLVEGVVSICSGSLLSPNRVVTAALCWFDGYYQAIEFEVVLGTTINSYMSPIYAGDAVFGEGLRVKASAVVTHARWIVDWRDRINIAMVYLSTPVIYSAYIQPIDLPDSYAGETFEGEIATFAGYGVQRDNPLVEHLRLNRVSQVNLLVLSNDECSRISNVQGRITRDNDWVFDTTLCTSGFRGVGVCIGDTGGPLFVIRDGKPVLIGIASVFPQFKCSSGLPSGFTRVTSVLDFIYNNL